MRVYEGGPFPSPAPPRVGSPAPPSSPPPTSHPGHVPPRPVPGPGGRPGRPPGPPTRPPGVALEWAVTFNGTLSSSKTYTSESQALADVQTFLRTGQPGGSGGVPAGVTATHNPPGTTRSVVIAQTARQLEG